MFAGQEAHVRNLYQLRLPHPRETRHRTAACQNAARASTLDDSHYAKFRTRLGLQYSTASVPDTQSRFQLPLLDELPLIRECVGVAGD